MTSIRIPKDWTGEEALAITAFLERLELTIWAAHGHEMARCLRRADEQQAAWLTAPSEHIPPDDDEEDEDIPF